ncbi:putative C2H2 finger domain protein [Trichoderma barbatum]
MDSTHPFSDGPWYCKHCQKPFSAWEDLVQHKKQMRDENKEDHIHCKFCGRDFQTLEGEMKHMQVDHPLEQKLDCPGCGQGPFKRLGTLMSHIERGFCTRIDSVVLDELREQKLEFPRRLEQLTQESIKGNYMKYMPSANATNSISGWHVEKEPTSFKVAPEEFPILSNTAVNPTQPPTVATSKEPNPSIGSQKQKYAVQHLPQLPFRPANKTEAASVSGGEKKAQDSIQLPLRPLVNSNRDNIIETPTSTQLAQPAFKSGVTTVVAGMDPDDPNSPAFNVARYYCSITEKFNCPRRLCGKVFKTARGLVGHLRSPVHGNKTYRCPCCLRIFKTLAGIASHAEARGSKCGIQDTVHYETFMDQLTAGIVDIERTRYQDGSVIFKTSEQVKQKLRGETTENKVKYPVNTDPQMVYW